VDEFAGIVTSFASGCRSSWFWILCHDRSMAQSEFGVRIDRGASATRGRSSVVSRELLLMLIQDLFHGSINESLNAGQGNEIFGMCVRVRFEAFQCEMSFVSFPGTGSQPRNFCRDGKGRCGPCLSPNWARGGCWNRHFNRLTNLIAAA
jgi:hypothetical protein